MDCLSASQIWKQPAWTRAASGVGGEILKRQLILRKARRLRGRAASSHPTGGCRYADSKIWSQLTTRRWMRLTFAPAKIARKQLL